jgi:hypothetical protein
MGGRHAAPPSYRDLAIVGLAVIVIGVLVYLGLSALASSDGPDRTTTTVAVVTTVPATTEVVTTTTTATTTSTAPTTTTAALLSPDQIRVQVLNAIGVSGLAGEVTQDLTALGYQMLLPGNYQPTLPQSRVWYADGFEAEAYELAAEFPDAVVERASSEVGVNADIVVVLGESYQR